MNWNKRNHLKTTVAGLGLMMLTACNGIFDDIYDKPEEIVPAKGQIVMDATSWTDWYYVDLDRLHQLATSGDEAALLKAQTELKPTRYRCRPQATGWTHQRLPMRGKTERSLQPKARKQDSICIGLMCLARHKEQHVLLFRTDSRADGSGKLDLRRASQ